MSLKVALVQDTIEWEDRDANLKKYRDLLRTITHEVDIVLLPEMFTSGFTMNVKQCADEMAGESIAWMKNTAKELQAAIAGSLIIKKNSRYYNRFCFVTPEGRVHTYDKRHLFRMAEEEKYFTEGRNRTIVEYKGWKVLLQICYDLRFPVWSRNRVRVSGDGKVYDYDLMLYIANWPEKRKDTWRTLLQARAMENQAYVAGVNRIGNDGNGISYSGDSALIDPLGDRRSTLAPHEARVEIVTLEKAILNEAREKFPVLLDGDEFKIEY